VKIYNTVNLKANTKLTPNHKSWIYNGLDCCVTLEVRNRLREDLKYEPDNVKETYETAMAKLAPVGYMCMKGLKIDFNALNKSLSEYRSELRQLQKNFDKICDKILGYPINWRSPTQLKVLFYDTFGLKPIRKRNAQGFFAPTTNADALERLSVYRYPQIWARYILAMRILGKKISFLETSADKDGRMRTSLNIAGTDTGRFASQFSAFGTGTNLQNVEDRLRRVFVADPGHIMVNVDLEQADARNVAARLWQIYYDSHGPEKAGAYLDACESGDLHTRVCSMAWKELEWPDPWDATLARSIADSKAYRELSYRDMAKKLGHGTNYYGLPRTMAMHTKTEASIIENFQARYFNAFPLIGNIQKDLSKDDWHGWVYRQLKTVGYLNNLFGRRRIFFDRYKDPRTLRAAIAYDPQSTTGEELDRGWLQLWHGMPEALLQLPVHDSILFQLPLDGLQELLPRALKLLTVTKELKGGRLFSVPLEATTGFNWGKSYKDKTTGIWINPHGQKLWTGNEDRQPPKQKTRLKHYLS